MTRSVLIAGCGDIGTRLGRLLATGGNREVFGLRRDTSRLPAAIIPLAGNLLDPDSLKRIPRRWDALVYCPTPAERTEDAYRDIFIGGQQRLADRIECERTIFVSSTAVYGQDAGEWVDEDSETRPARFNGQVLVEAENKALELWGRTVVVRFGGIYGPGREALIRTVLAGPAEVQADPPYWTNRIHSEDCAAMVAWLLGLERPRRVYAGVDRRPAPRFEVLSWLSKRVGAQPPKPLAKPGAGQGKRVRNDRIAAEGFTFRFPDYRAGYADLTATAGWA